MNAQACASPDVNKGWNSINWKKSESYVKKLQARIVKAQQEGRHNKVKALQWTLTHSFYAKALAVKRVTGNKGKGTPGVDGITWSTPDAKFRAILSLKRRGYSPQPLRRVYIPKSNGKMRPLSIPTMIDRAMQTLYKFALEPLVETCADPNSYGFRKGRCTQDAITHCHMSLTGANAPTWILEGDIKGCFDNISHEWIIGKVPMDKEILRKFLKCGYVDMGKLFQLQSGTPQGGSLSPIICVYVLSGLEKQLKSKFYAGKKGGKYYNPKVNFTGYADDFIVTGKSPELLEKEVLPLIRAFMAERGLKLSEDKTVITNIQDGFDFLGCNIRKYNKKVLTKPSKKNIQSFMRKIQTIIKANQTAQQENLIHRLNPVINGWVNYHKHNVSKEVFGKVDHQIWQHTWQWAKRRHHEKGNYWIYNKYYHFSNSRKWIFGAPTGSQTESGEKKYVNLVKATDTKIRRFTKIKSEANPFDSTWDEYFEEREALKMSYSLNGRQVLLKMFNMQRGKCPLCGNNITEETGFTVEKGVTENHAKSLIHPQCHEEFHSLQTGLSRPYNQRDFALA